jgi:hypothetical protein
MDTLRFWRPLLHEANPPPQTLVELYQQACREQAEGRGRQAAPMLSEAVRDLEEREAPQAAAANHHLAVVLQDLGDTDGAVFHCVRAVFLYQRGGDALGLYAGLRNLAVIHRSRQEDAMAIGAQREAARVRAWLESMGSLDRAEQGRDSLGEQLPLLSLAAARPMRAAVG